MEPVTNSGSRENIQTHIHYHEPERSESSCHFKDNYSAKREKLFNKVVTRSDIKQYRFAIPKHQAHKHFLAHVASTSRGAFLCMEDNDGKLWRFKYSFWKSSQGYMLTSEWNRFVKEKRVSAGDMVSFLRSTGPDKRLFIDWKPQNQSGLVAKPELLESTQTGRAVKLFGVNISTN
ncbi:hypothetical protein RHSIM_Rhsim12G0144600 [Rhododendron simsii]|uniref:TF-B3 domain-containing protein n=1 Tax=Rhododendron simsii TaxID=118357 RepID=A0A834LA25_RHOSS|nr:hypothetical protein RHSIM_Rhsim12G0144600 [Rhododendron simsii]